MNATKTDGQATVIATYPDHASAEDAVRRLQKDGFPMQNLSIILRFRKILIEAQS